MAAILHKDRKSFNHFLLDSGESFACNIDYFVIMAL